MIFLAILSVATVLAAAALRRRPDRERDAARLGMAAAMAFAGVSHWLMPTPFLQHLPDWAPWPDALIAVTGGVELALGAALLLSPPWRRWAGRALAAYLVAVFPANVYVAVAGVEVDGQPGGAYPWVRLPLQVLFVAWSLWSTSPQPRPGAARPPTGSSARQAAGRR